MRCLDLFAGAGGFSTGAVQAGCTVVAAANHWPAAVEAHSRNHPSTQHICQDLCQADFTTFPTHDILLASPECRGHTRARGKEAKHHDASRSTAWAVISCAEVHRPHAIVAENVPEFLRWQLYPAWKSALYMLGYDITENVVNAADYGVPQNRVRALIIAMKGRAPRIQAARRPKIPARAIINLDAGRWGAIKRAGRSENTLRRIVEGRKQHGQTFIIAYYGSERGGRSIDVPLGTVTTRERFAVVHKDCMRMLSVDEYRAAMGFQPDYWLPNHRKTAVKLLGNAVPPALAMAALEWVLKSA